MLRLGLYLPRRSTCRLRKREEEVECMQNEAVQERKSSEWGKWRYGLSVLHAENIHPQAAGTELLI